jgi:antitoxin component YwqK of YwqJK toxin-antitoxin module
MLRIISTLLLCICFTSSYSQTTQELYFDTQGKLASKTSASFYSRIIQNTKDTTLYTVETFYISKSKKATGKYKAQRFPVAWGKLHEFGFSDALKEGKHEEYYESGQILSSGDFVKGLFIGKHQRWYENGKLLSEVSLVNNEETVKSYYENGTLEMQYRTVAGRMEGEVMVWNSNGKKKKKAKFKDGTLVDKEILFDEQEREVPVQ